tara:strand:+ start:351 stop:755 length:405 start_codon:yes stop_codon:yes gene_type:complete
MRLIFVDTLSTILFFTILAALTELYVVGMEPADVLKTRLIMVPLMILTGRPYGVWRDWFFVGTKPTVLWSKSLIDGAAFLTFQLPIYGLTLWIVGADFDEIGTALGSAVVLMLIVSRPFGLFLQAMRKIADVGT